MGVEIMPVCQTCPDAHMNRSPAQLGRARIRPPRGFTLIELLVVIAIIALLISILLPALSGAKMRGQAAVCLSNVKQLTHVFFLYAQDNEGMIPGTYWQGPINLDWGGKQNAAYLANPTIYRHPMETSPLWKYLGGAEKTLECPTAKRWANLNFDYTVIIRFAGAKTDIVSQMTYPENPAAPNSFRKRFDVLPFLIEEDDKFYNQSYPDGSFAADDQFSNRHFKGGHIGNLDGSVTRFVSPRGPQSDVAEPADLQTNDLRLVSKQREYPVGSSNENEFGWVNNPK